MLNARFETETALGWADAQFVILLEGSTEALRREQAKMASLANAGIDSD